METETYLCTGKLRHDGKVFAEGDELDLSEEQAAPLLIDGAIVKSPTARKKSPQKKTASDKPEA